MLDNSDLRNSLHHGQDDVDWKNVFNRSLDYLDQESRKMLKDKESGRGSGASAKTLQLAASGVAGMVKEVVRRANEGKCNLKLLTKSLYECCVCFPR